MQTITKIHKIAAFSVDGHGGNPAGVMLRASLPDEAAMQRIAAEVGYSETVFAAPHLAANGERDGWRVRYFSPGSEVPFCGHATIALGAVLARQYGPGVFPLTTNHARVTVEGLIDGGQVSAALQSPPTSSKVVMVPVLVEALALFGYTPNDLDRHLQAILMNGGAQHLLLPLASRELLRAMRYDLAAGRDFMRRHGLVTIALVYAETPTLFHARNAFASGGVYEDPATGAAAAALGGYLRELGWPHGGRIDIMQGEDMGMPSHLRVDISGDFGASVRVSGATRELGD